MEPITIFEHETWPSRNNIIEKELAKKIRLEESDYNIINFLKEKDIVDFDVLEHKGVRIKAKKYIGAVQFSKFNLRIVPKIYKKTEPEIWKNIVQCMHFARNYSPEKMIQFEKIPISSKDILLQDFLIWTLVYECQGLVRRGLLKSYVTHEENLPYLKGKLVLKNQFQNDIRKKVFFFCEYDELEFDNIENRIILQTLIQCRRIAINSELKKEIFKLIQQFSGIVQKVPITLDDIKRVLRSYTRQNIRYKDAHIICEMIRENKGISDFYHHGEESSFSIPFFVDMNKIFEDFVTRLFSKYFDDDEEIIPQAKQKAWNVNESNRGGVSMIPDIVLKNKRNEITIIDAKYKKKLEVSDLYQIGFYIHEYASENKLQEIKKAYAILPKYFEGADDQKNFEATKSKIKIHAKFISINDYLKLIKGDNAKNAIKDKIEQEILGKILIPTSH
jgi:5-methylcytosine-specific restriction enzyme subunit McrC